MANRVEDRGEEEECRQTEDLPGAAFLTSRDSRHGTASRPRNATGQDKASRLVNIMKCVAFVRDRVRLSEMKVCSDLNPNRLGKATEVGTFQKVISMPPLGKVWTNCLKNHNVISMYPPVK